MENWLVQDGPILERWLTEKAYFWELIENSYTQMHTVFILLSLRFCLTSKELSVKGARGASLRLSSPFGGYCEKSRVSATRDGELSSRPAQSETSRAFPHSRTLAPPISFIKLTPSTQAHCICSVGSKLASQHYNHLWFNFKVGFKTCQNCSSPVVFQSFLS